MVTVTLRDGSRLDAVLPPVSKPLVLTVRKQQLKRFLGLGDLVAEGALRAAAHTSPGGGSAEQAIPDGERTCVLETETDLWLHDLRERHCFSLEARDATVEGAGRITQRELFQRAALRQRPERVIVGEVRGEEAMEMPQAMTSGHDGSLTTIHASSVPVALHRLETLASRVQQDGIRFQGYCHIDLTLAGYVAILRITRGNIRQIHRLMRQIDHVLVANQLQVVTQRSRGDGAQESHHRIRMSCLTIVHFLSMRQ
jgi:pilus assembly protein CpaF